MEAIARLGTRVNVYEYSYNPNPAVNECGPAVYEYSYSPAVYECGPALYELVQSGYECGPAVYSYSYSPAVRQTEGSKERIAGAVIRTPHLFPHVRDVAHVLSFNKHGEVLFDDEASSFAAGGDADPD